MNSDSDFSVPAHDASDFVDLVRFWAAERPGKAAFTFLAEGEDVTARLTYAELDQRSRAVAAELRRRGQAGERALLLYPSGLDFVAGLFGCLRAGYVAVPAYPPHSDKHGERLRAIAADCAPKVVLTTGQLTGPLAAAGLPREALLPSDELGGQGAAEDVAATAGTLALLQYTSGSTGTPKGVLLTHGNLLDNCRMMAVATAHSATPVYLSWLPLFHDMGLIANLLESVYWGAECVFMPPEAFLADPTRWLRAISTHRGTYSSAPNFAYELCLRREFDTLDLSTWRVAVNAAEPVRADTLRRFHEAFRRFGLEWGTLYPAYGLAENAVFATGGRPGTGPVVHHLDGAALERDRVVEVPQGTPGSRAVVACGGVHLQQRIQVVDPVRGRKVGPGEVGEIWLSGPSLSQGYWNRPADSEEAFGGVLAGEPGRWLRTGDKGFLDEAGEICVTGRIKDLIIIRGRNIYPQDVEQTVERAHPSIRPGCGAAFAVEVEGTERLVVVTEVRGQAADPGEVGPAAAEAVARDHDIVLEALVLLPARTVPKTTSGKISRSMARRAFLDGTLPAAGQWRRTESTVRAVAPGTALIDQVVAAVAGQLGLPPDHIDPALTFASLGVDSAAAMAISGALQRRTGRRVPAAALYNHPTPQAMAAFLSGAPVPAQPKPVPAQPKPQPAAAEPIAVVGLACRLPGADGPDALWDLLLSGSSAISEVPPDRWDIDRIYDPSLTRPGTVGTRWGGFLPDVAGFDADFFGISPVEAMGLDPQQRLLLELVWEALEHAGINPAGLAGSATGVFVGVSNNDYARLLAPDPDALDQYYGTGNAASLAANRVSYALDLRGPSLVVDTACSSALVALHLACQSLRRGEAAAALVGAVNLILTPHLTTAFSRARMMAPDGRCKAFDDRADGYVRSEGGGVVVLKPLSRALADGDDVRAVIRGSAIGQDGHSNGLTAPNGSAQQAVLAAAWADAGVRPAELGYVEAHGTGTALGDPIEYEALTAALDGADECLLGSVKTNLGHLEAAAGMAGLLKVVLMLRNRMIPPHLHLNRINAQIANLPSPLRIPVEPTAWVREPRVAGVSSFGFGGTNAHVVLAEASTPPARPDAPKYPERPAHLLTVSAQSPAALAALAGRYAAVTADSVDIADLCFSAGVGRAELPYRLAVTGRDREQIHQRLAEFTPGEHRAVRRPPTVAFLFPGQGAHRPNMGVELRRIAPDYGEAFDRCARIVDAGFGFDLHEVVKSEERLASTEFAQPALFAVEYALACWWWAMGAEPALLVGHSLGEYVAACLAGVFSLEDALLLVGTRARMMAQLPSAGAMAAVRAGEAEVLDLLTRYENEVWLAAANGPHDTVVAGYHDAVRRFIDEARERGHTAARFRASHAFHSGVIDPVLAEFRGFAETIPMRPPELPVISTLTGAEASDSMATVDYWIRQMREPVRFGDALTALREAGCGLGIEAGPDAPLTRLAKSARGGAVWTGSLRQGTPEWPTLLEALGTCWVAGLPVDWERYERPMLRKRIALPLYPFQRRRFWPDTAAQAQAQPPAPAPAQAVHPLLGRRLPDLSDPGVSVWQQAIGRNQIPIFDDHRIQGQPVAPGTSYVEMALAAAREVTRDVPYRLTDVEYVSVLGIPPIGARLVQVSLTGRPGDELAVAVRSRADSEGGDWSLHARATLVPVSTDL